MSNSSKPRRRALGRLIPRLIVGGYFVGHGAAEAVRRRSAATASRARACIFESIGLKPGELNAQVAAAAELGGGGLLVLGLFPTLAGMPLIATMVTAARPSTLEKGLWLADGGVEYTLVMIAAVDGHRRCQRREAGAQGPGRPARRRRSPRPGRSRPASALVRLSGRSGPAGRARGAGGSGPRAAGRRRVA